MNEKIESLVAQMTLEEKTSMLAGADLWHTVPVARLGVPAIKVTDGPNGARGSLAAGGPSSACFPVGATLGATWNPALVRRVGEALAAEVKAKGAHVLLAPTVNIHRSPLAGRNFECYSEDPLLSGKLAAAYIAGLQSQGVGACIKHYVCNDSEFERQSISSEVSERALREIYLMPFMIAIREARPWCVMSAYNRLNGTYCSENPYILRDILKGEWGFDGVVMSDWFGSYSPAVAAGGLDLEMPGPARWMGEKVSEAVRAGELSVEAIDDKARRLLRLIEQVRAFAQPELAPEQAIDRPEHRALIREAAGEAIVLLKNEGRRLPLDLGKLKSLAVIGAHAKWPAIQGGGSAHVTPHYVVTPLEGIRDKTGGSVKVAYAVGCMTRKMTPLIETGWLVTADAAQNGLTVQYFGEREMAGAPIHTAVVEETQLTWFGDAAPAGVDARRLFVRVSGTFTPPESGTYTFGLMSFGQSRLFIGDELLIDNWDTPIGMIERTAQVEMTGGQPYPLRAEFAKEGEPGWYTLRLGCMPPLPPDLIGQAVALAAQSDAAVVFVGTSDEWESEGYDRADMELPGAQNELVQRVAAANPNTIVVLNTGAPVAMPWLDAVPAVLQLGFPGQEAGNAVADVLCGDVNPSGKLPTTYPRRLQDNPTYLNYPGECGKVYYGEGLFVGYRYYDKKEIEPLFPFGHGLSYTTFAYRKLSLNKAEYAPGEEVRVSVEIENTGARAGKEVVQLYVRDVESRLARPPQELKAFEKVALAPGERRTVEFTLGADALSFYDPLAKAWTAEPGEFEVLVGASSRDIRLTARFTLKGAEIKKTARLHIGLPLKALLEDEAGRATLEKHFPEMIGRPELAMAMGMSLEEIAPFAPGILTPEKLQEVNEDLARV